MARTAQRQGGAGNPREINMAQRNLVLGRSLEMWQPIFQSTLSGTIPGQQITVPIRNVGLIKRFLIKIEGTVAQSASETQTLTDFGFANLLSNVTLTDLNNQQRVNTPGWHLHFLASARRQAPFGFATTRAPAIMNNTFNCQLWPSSVTTATSFRHYVEVPVSYGDLDLRGAIYAGLVNATGQLQFTFNSALGVASTGNGALSVYKSSATNLPTFSAVTVTVYQNYLDQLPTDKSGNTILPTLDLGISYDIKQTTNGGLVASQDNPISYANYRDFLSTTVVYDNTGLNAATDITKFKIQAANYTSLLDMDPYTVALRGGRWNMDSDFPKGTYYFDHRDKPISTIQWGNMQLVVVPASVAASTSQILVGWEALAYMNEIIQAGSLYGQ